MSNTNKPQIPKNTTELLQKDLIKINEDKKQLENIKNQLKDLLTKINNILSKHDNTWSEHMEKYINKSVSQLDKLNITLTDEEKAMLRDTNHSNIEEKRKNLKEKFKINVPKNITDFAVGIYDACASALSRNLQKLDNVPQIIKNLSAINEENTDASKIKSQFQKQYNELTKTATELKKQALAVPGISEEQLENIQLLVNTIPALQKAIAPKIGSKTVEEDAQKLD